MTHHLKRLQHGANSDLHVSSNNHHSQETNSFTHSPQLPNDEAIRESIRHFTVPPTKNKNPRFSRSFNPGPQRARRGGGGSGGGGHSRGRLLPKRAINYDLAESFMDHSTNPLSSNLYKIKFKHSAKQWPNGRFINYKEKLDKLDGNIIEITYTRTIPIVPKRKKIEEINQNDLTTTDATSLLASLDPITQGQKKKQADKQTNIYANLFGVGKIPRLSSTNQTKKTNCIVNSTPSAASISLLGGDTDDH